jgi:nucleoside diphosphate kinase
MWLYDKVKREPRIKLHVYLNFIFFFEIKKSGPFKAMILSSPNAIKEWRGLIGPTHPVR